MKARNHLTCRYDGAENFGSRGLAVRKALQWASGHGCFHYFTDNHRGAPYPHGGFPTMLAVGEAYRVPLRNGQVFNDLQAFLARHADWLIGYFGYDLKNETEALASRHPDRLGMPDAAFYVPAHLLFFGDESVEIASLADPGAVVAEIAGTAPPQAGGPVFAGEVRLRTPEPHYLRTVERLRGHILDGDMYEANYCVEFYAENATLQPLPAFLALTEASPMPFSVFGRMGPHYLLCASPERFLKKTGSRLVSMPIKGTARRGADAAEDAALRQHLQHSEKERAENMMIVDLVRNDLARSAATGTVRVEELFGVYTFAALHQMISTVSAELRPGLSATDALRHAFPMGSMTGAPKIKAMQLIEQYEDHRRGLYSGAAGYFTPNQDFDFNVVIRSLLYNAETGYLSFPVGSAITYDAVAESEYGECLLKAAALRRVLGA